MKIYGNHLDELHTEFGAKYFMEMYGRAPHRFMSDFKLECTLRLNNDSGLIRNIIFLEYDGYAAQVFHMEADDRIYVYSDPNLVSCGVFNSEQGAFMDVFDSENNMKSYFVASSPYCLDSSDEEWDELHDDGFDGVVADIHERLPDIGEVNTQNTIFVRQL